MNNTLLIEKKQLEDIANWMKIEHPAELPEVLQGIFLWMGMFYQTIVWRCTVQGLECWPTDVITARFQPCYLDIFFINGGTDVSLFSQIFSLHLLVPILRCKFSAWAHHADSVWMVCVAVACRFFDRSRSDHSESRYLVSKKLLFRQTSWQSIYTPQDSRQRWQLHITISRYPV